jgi:hypothetical protein
MLSLIGGTETGGVSVSKAPGKIVEVLAAILEVPPLVVSSRLAVDDTPGPKEVGTEVPVLDPESGRLGGTPKEAFDPRVCEVALFSNVCVDTPVSVAVGTVGSG